MARKTGVCRSCGARIMWATTAKGKKMPVDVDPQICSFQVPGEFYRDPVKKVVIVFRDGKLAVVVNSNELFTAHTSHFDTCPYADEHRKKS